MYSYWVSLQSIHELGMWDIFGTSRFSTCKIKFYTFSCQNRQKFKISPFNEVIKVNGINMRNKPKKSLLDVFLYNIHLKISCLIQSVKDLADWHWKAFAPCEDTFCPLALYHPKQSSTISCCFSPDLFCTGPGWWTQCVFLFIQSLFIWTCVWRCCKKQR